MKYQFSLLHEFAESSYLQNLRRDQRIISWDAREQRELFAFHEEAL
jgi:hypothetical protein